MAKKKENQVALPEKFENDVQILKGILGKCNDREILKCNYALLENRIDYIDTIEMAVDMYKKTGDSYFLKRLTGCMERVLSDGRYETGVYSEICENINILFDEETISDDLCFWVEEWIVLVLRFAVVRNCKVFIDSIFSIAQKWHLSISEIYRLLLNMYSGNDRDQLLIEFRKCKPSYPCCGVDCFCVKKLRNFMNVHKDEVCDMAACKILKRIIYFSTSICLYRIWLDKASWKNQGEFDLGFERHLELCECIEEAFETLEKINCDNETINMELFKAQYDLFWRTYIDS